MILDEFADKKIILEKLNYFAKIKYVDLRVPGKLFIEPQKK